MDYILCSKEYKEFYDQIQQDVYSPNEMLANIGKAIGPVARKVNLGRLDASLKAPRSTYVPDGVDATMVVYTAPEGYAEQPIIHSYETGEKGICTIIAKPVKGHTFTADEMQAVQFLAENLYMLSGRSRLMGLMQKVALTDNMTGVYNTSGMMKYGGELSARRQLQNYNGIFINMKNFKYINKMITARQGDIALQCYAQKLQHWLGEDGAFARLGGDNFYALVKKNRTNEFLAYASELEVSVEFGGAPKIFHLASRMGIYPLVDSDTMSEAMNNSSIALNIARSSVTEDIVWFQPEMLERTIHQKMVSSVFPQALKDEEFVVYYQPKVQLDGNALCGCEALVRWIRDGRLIPPMDFIPILEKEGTVCALDFYVFEHVCQDIRDWLDAGVEPVCTSVNFSKIHLHDKNLAKNILDVMEQYRIDSQYIEVELTEMSGYEDYEALSSFVHAIKESGIRTSIDDFGTGYSSLNMLKDLNADVIKLDKTFLDHLRYEDSRQDEIVIKNVVNMINELDMEAIAEGVETQEQADFLRKVKCCMAQGYLYDRPLPHDEFEQRLTENRIYQK